MAGRVLVVDDFAPWRAQIRSALQGHSEWQIVGEASDGLEAVHQAAALTPDLILLDIGLPSLNGIEASGRILSANPDARILFVAEHWAYDIAEAALTTGARGYILKSDASRELLRAMEATRAGRRFVGARLAGRGVDRPGPQEMRHAVAFHSDGSSVVDDFVQFGAAALDGGHSLIVLLDDQRRGELDQKLQSRNIDLELAIRQGRYLPSDPAKVLSLFMIGGWPDERRFWDAVISLVMQAARGSKVDHPRVFSCGACAPTLLKEGRPAAAIRLEELWDEFTMTFNVDTVCGYTIDPEQHVDDEVIRKICAAHSVVHSR